ncbi:MAG: DEAD/DEAH box helicase [Thermodesulfobacteriota bacterium]
MATAGELAAALTASARFASQVVLHEVLPPGPPSFQESAPPWPPFLDALLQANGIASLYSHQVQATAQVRAGRHVVVATPTASGKSLIYNLPVLEHLATQPDSHALYLFPLKALAQDQQRALTELTATLPAECRPSTAIFDGDTPATVRRRLRGRPPQILLTNPEMLHLSLLAHHASWQGFFSRLSHVILDEVHTYRGVFGSHMAWVLRRLQRICRQHGCSPTFVLSSATIANPGELASALLNAPVAAVTASGAPRCSRHLVLMNPEASAAGTACEILAMAVSRGLRTIVYTQSRKATELIYLWTRQRLGNLGPHLASYRAGYTPAERREIEGRLASGALLGVVATSALELGIDIGGLDVCVLVGFPGSMMATWQRGGRVGRRQQQEAAIILVAREDALDQYFMRHPQELCRRPLEAAVINPDNEEIARRHLLCAAAELPLSPGDPLLDSDPIREALSNLGREGHLLMTGDGKAWFCDRRHIHRTVDLRGAGSPFTIRLTGRPTPLGQIDDRRCLKECHPGAVYLHRGETYLVTDLDLAGREITAEPRSVNYFTRGLTNKETSILQQYETKAVAGTRVSWGRLQVTEKVVGYERRLVHGQRLVSSEALDLPPVAFETEGLWLEIPATIRTAMERSQIHVMGGIHAVEHAAIGILPLIVLCDRNDVGGISQLAHPQLPGAAIFLYDGHAGGIGLCRKAFQEIATLLAATRQTVASCPCELGCPSCVHSPKCGSGNRPIDKAAAMRILDGLLDTTATAAGTWQPAPLARPRPVAGSCPVRRYGVLDVETKRSAAEVGGWQHPERMGLSLAVLYDSSTDSCEVFAEDRVPDLLAAVQDLDLLVGFNIKRFDRQVLAGYHPRALDGVPVLDLLEEVHRRLGYRLSLQHLAEHSLGRPKTADGLQALAWFKAGRLDLIADYCRNDVLITRDLFRLGQEKGYLLFRNKAGSLVRLPVNW